MSNANQEIIEARLAGYIDDELDVGERAEIEQHLQQNPQYRRLLDELRTGRQMLRALPRESAPPEFADAFFAQLERSGLLDGEVDPSPLRMRLDAWPRWAAAAAVVFLTVGLAAILYFMLPRHDAQTVAYVPKPIPDVAGESGESPANKGDESPSNRDLKQAVAGEAGAAPVIDDLDQLASAVSRDPHIKDLLADAGSADVVANTSQPISADAVVMVVRAGDPSKVHKELNAYLASRNIEYQPISQSVEVALNASLSHPVEQSAQPSSINARLENDPNAAREKVAPTPQKTDALANGGSLVPGKAPHAPAAPTAPGDQPDSPNLGQVPAKPGALTEERRLQAEREMLKNPAPVAPGSINRTPPAAGSPPSAPAAATPAFGSAHSAAPVPPPVTSPAPAPIAKAAPLAADQQQRQAATESSTAANAAGANSFVVVRRLSRLQAHELNACLARAGEVREADIDRRDAIAALDNRVAEGASNTPTSIRPDGAGKGNSARATDALAKSNDAGPSPMGADKGLLRKEMGLGRGSGIAAGPTTRPSNGVALADASPPPAPGANADASRRRAMDGATRPAVGGTTQPAAADAEADRLIDVVIVVRNSTPAEPNLDLPAAAPATPTQKAALPVPATQPAPAGPFPLSK